MPADAECLAKPVHLENACMQPGGIPCGMVFSRQTFDPGFALTFAACAFIPELST